MRTILLFLIALATAASFFAAEPRSAKPAATSKLIIDNKGGTDFEPSSGRIVVHDKVQVFESELYMECELLTVLQQTNSSGKTATGGDRVGPGERQRPAATGYRQWGNSDQRR